MSVRRSDLVRIDKQHVWHPWTRMQQYIETQRPLVIESAQGARLYDVDGRSFLDATSSWWVATLGHAHPRLIEALVRQAQVLPHTSLDGIAHEPAATLAELLCDAAPAGLARVFYSDNGSTAVEVALKMALQFWQNEGAPERKVFVALEHAFHGDTLGAAGVSGIDIVRQTHDPPLACVRVPPPGGALTCEEAAGKLDAILRARRGEIAAFIIEPRVQGGAGMRMHPAEYLRAVRQACAAHEVLFIADEVFVGYGRTGSMWACDSAGISPDLMCLSKGFTGGLLPMAATLATERIFRAFFGGSDRAFLHGHSFCGNPLGAAVAAEVLRVFRDEGIIERARGKAERIAAAFARMAGIPGTSRARALGLIGAIDLADDPSPLGETGWRVAAHAQARGVLLAPLGDVVYIAPPLTIADEELDEILDVISDSIGAAWGA